MWLIVVGINIASFFLEENIKQLYFVRDSFRVFERVVEKGFSRGKHGYNKSLIKLQ